MELDPCPCGNPRTYHKGVAVCSSHCDVPCIQGGGYCKWCRTYGARVNARVIDEHEAERRQRGTQ